MRSDARQFQFETISSQKVDEQQIRLEMTLSKARPVSNELMVPIGFW